MKTQILTIVFTVIASVTFAQKTDAILLPHNEEGFVRLMVMNHNNEPVTVLFKKGDRVIKKDKIRTTDLEKGFVKLYDIRNLSKGDYTIEIQNQGNQLSYDFTTRNNESVSNQYWKQQLNNNTRFAGLKQGDSLALITGN